MHTYIRVCVCVRACARIYTCIHIYIYMYYTSALSQHARTDRGWPGITKGRLKVAQARTITFTRAVYTRRQSQLRNATALLRRVFFPACATGRAGAGRPPSPVLNLRGCGVSLQEKMSSVHSAWRCGRPGRGAGRSPGGGRTTEDEKSGRKGGRALILTRTRSGPGSGRGSSGRDVSGGGAWGLAEEPDAISSWRGASP